MFSSFRKATSSSGFRHRSHKRDLKTDLERVGRIADALNAGLTSSEKERDGLRRRLNDLLARAALSHGNDVDEYISREDERTQHLNLFDSQMRSAEQRLLQLDQSVEHFKFLKKEFAQRFHDIFPPKSI